MRTTIQIDTKSTRTYNYQYVRIFKGFEQISEGKYRYQNRSWQRYEFQSALISAIKDVPSSIFNYDLKKELIAMAESSNSFESAGELIITRLEAI